eukprot:COSAG01_NODE_18599_length_1065_cov_1.299172_1_plen_129_part_00
MAVMLLRILLLAAALPLLLQGAAAATPSVPAVVAVTGPRLLSGRALSSDRALLSFDPSTVGTGLLTCLSPGHQLEMLITSSSAPPRWQGANIVFQSGTAELTVQVACPGAAALPLLCERAHLCPSAAG